MKLKHFKVTMVEVRDGQKRTITQEAIVSSREEVIRIYGLDNDDIVEYSIEEI